MNEFCNRILLNIFEFLKPGEVFIMYEVNSRIKNFIKEHKNIEKSLPFTDQLTTSCAMIDWTISLKNFHFSPLFSVNASKSNNLDVLKYIAKNKGQISINCYRQAILNNNNKMLKWLCNRNIKISEEALFTAITTENSKIVKWLIKHDCDVSSEILNHSAFVGNYNIFKILMKTECEWDMRLYNYACMGGNLKILKYIINIAQYDLSKQWFNHSVYISAAIYGHLHIIKYIREKMRLPLLVLEDIIDVAVENEHNHIIEWLNTSTYIS